MLSIASRRGLIAAGGPDSLVVAGTEQVRNTFLNSTGGTAPFQAQLNISLPFRVAQVAFSADENFLVVSAENAGGLAIYLVEALMQGNTSPTGEISTHNAGLRALVPNPTVEKAELFAVVTTNGELLMANLQTQTLLSGTNGPVMKTGVSSVSWSNRGKQLVAGLSDGTGFQMTPEGEGKAIIPRAPEEGPNSHGTYRGGMVLYGGKPR